VDGFFCDIFFFRAKALAASNISDGRPYISWGETCYTGFRENCPKMPPNRPDEDESAQRVEGAGENRDGN